MSWLKYASALRYIRNSPSAANGHTLSLFRFKLLLRIIGDPQLKLRNITVCGSFGESTTARMVSSVLTDNNYNVGTLYDVISTEDPCSSIRINGKAIDALTFAAAVSIVSGAESRIVKAYEAVMTDAREGRTFAEDGIAGIAWLLYRRGISPKLALEEIMYAVAAVCFKNAACDISVLCHTYGGSNTAPEFAFPPATLAVFSALEPEDEKISEKTETVRREIKEVVCGNCYPEAFTKLSGRCANEGVRLTTTVKSEINTEKRTYLGATLTYRKHSGIPIGSPFPRVSGYAALILELADALRRNGFHVSPETVTNSISKFRPEAPADTVILSVAPVIVISNEITVSGIRENFGTLSDIRSELGGKLYLFLPFKDREKYREVSLGIERMSRLKYDAVVLLGTPEQAPGFFDESPEFIETATENGIADLVPKLRDCDTMLIFPGNLISERVCDSVKHAITRKDIGRGSK